MPARPVGEEFLNVSAPLQDIGAKSDAYLASAAEDEGRLFFTPFFAFKADRDKKLAAIRQNPPPGQQLHSVLLTLLFSPQVKIEAITAFIRSQEQSAVPPGRFSSFQSKSLIPIPMTKLTIEEIAEGKVFKTVRLGEKGEETLQDEVTIETIGFTEEVADKLIADLREGRFIPRFKITYQLNAVFTDSASLAEVRVANAASTKAVQELLGSGRAFKFNLDQTGAALGADTTIITRDQKADFQGDLQNQITIAFVVQDPQDLAILRENVDKYINSALSPFNISLTDAFAKDIAKLSDFSFSPSDLQPDQINSLVASVKDAFQSKDETKIKTEFAAGASFLGIGGDASGSFALDTLQERMEEKGWQFETQGNITVPKSFEVFVIDKKSLRRESNFAISIKRETLQINTITAEVSTANRLPRVSGNLDVPLGAVLDWFRPDKDTAVPFGFRICDGGVIDDPESPFFNLRVYNSFDKVNMGVGPQQLGVEGGRADIPSDGDHDHQGRTDGAGKAQSQAGQAQFGDGDNFNHVHGIFSDGTHNHGGENRPPFVGVLKIMRIK
jgi:hypothetical protein